MKAMNHKERVLSALAHRGYDRLPVRYMGEPVVTQALIEHLRVADYETLLDRLGVDYRYVQPEYCGPAPRTYPDGSRELFWPDRGWPVPTRYLDVEYSQGVYTESVWRPFADITDPAELEGLHFPSADWLDYSQMRANCEKYPEHAHRHRLARRAGLHQRGGAQPRDRTRPDGHRAGGPPSTWR